MVIINNVPIFLHLLGSFNYYMLSFSSPSFSWSFHSTPPYPKCPDFLSLLLPVVFPTQEWQGRGGSSAGFGISLTEGKEIFVYYSTSSKLFIRSFIFHLSFPYLKAADMNIYHEVKKIELRFASAAEIHGGSKPSESLGVPSGGILRVFCFVFFFLGEHTLTGFVSSL